jgi:2-polyprenyl-3-methyl-5-hydroxy-6-metoxy-1,4-benzoquinol methylase
MTTRRSQVFDEHNREQVRYFERAGKEAMRPVGTPYVERQVQELCAYAELLPGERVLDVGCGMGRYTFPLAERGFLVEGLDLSASLLRELDRFNAGRYVIPLHCLDVVDAPDSLGARFDAVVGFFTLHHLHDLVSSFDAMSRLVKPGGRVVFLEPNPLNPLYYVQIVASPGMTWKGDRGILKMRPKTVFAAMARAGMQETSTRRFGLFPPFVANLEGGSDAERALERVPLWRPLLAFQLFRATRPVPSRPPGLD